MRAMRIRASSATAPISTCDALSDADINDTPSEILQNNSRLQREKIPRGGGPDKTDRTRQGSGRLRGPLRAPTSSGRPAARVGPSLPAHEGPGARPGQEPRAGRKSIQPRVAYLEVLGHAHHHRQRKDPEGGWRGGLRTGGGLRKGARRGRRRARRFWCVSEPWKRLRSQRERQRSEYSERKRRVGPRGRPW